MKTYFLYCFIKKWFHILVYHFKFLTQYEVLSGLKPVTFLHNNNMNEPVVDMWGWGMGCLL